jgi:hypothetical protein
VALYKQLLVQRATLVFLSLGLPLRSVGVYSKPNSSYSDPNELEQCPYLFLRPEAGRYTAARTENFDI